jgi:phosphopantothenoylcysteine decarboxylase/phosphopantothenate--cysteine ligase
VVVTAGGTREPIDPVRFIGNRSSGKMGVAVAEAALERGATVTLIAADVAVELPDGRARVARVETTAELRAALLDALFGGSSAPATPRFDALVMAAAVADFAPARPVDRKLARGEGMTLELVPTPDLLAEVARLVRDTHPADDAGRPSPSSPPVLVGFAAETGSLDRAAAKLSAKRVDLLVANDVSEAGSGFGTDTNRVVILDAAGGREELPLLSKREVADRLLDRVAMALDERDAAGQTGRMQEAQR